MKNLYNQYGLQTVINASGRMTKLGVSTISEKVGKAIMEGGSNYVVIEDLYREAGHALAKMIEAPDACVTSSASAAIAMAVASLICGNSVQNVHNLYDMLPNVKKREVILLRGQNIDFGAPVAEMIQVGGGKIVDAGYSNGSTVEDIEAAVTENTLAIFFVKSHHCVQKEMVSVEETVALANRLHIPCIIDASVEEDLKKYIKMGADFVCYSGAKAIEGPTSGFCACSSSEYADNMRLQFKGIGRVMKVGKETVMGLLEAVKEYLAGERVCCITKAELEEFAKKVGEIKGLKTSIIKDEAGREIYRCKIDFDKDEYGIDAVEAVKRLAEGEVAVYTRDYQMNLGSIAIDTRPLNSHEELEYIYTKLKDLAK